MIPQYPTHCVYLLHVKLQDGGVEFDAFVEIRNEHRVPVVPSAIFVDDGFFLHVYPYGNIFMAHAIITMTVFLYTCTVC